MALHALICRRFEKFLKNHRNFKDLIKKQSRGNFRSRVNVILVEEYIKIRNRQKWLSILKSLELNNCEKIRF